MPNALANVDDVIAPQTFGAEMSVAVLGGFALLGGYHAVKAISGLVVPRAEDATSKPGLTDDDADDAEDPQRTRPF